MKKITVILVLIIALAVGLFLWQKSQSRPNLVVQPVLREEKKEHQKVPNTCNTNHDCPTNYSCGVWVGTIMKEPTIIPKSCHLNGSPLPQ